MKSILRLHLYSMGERFRLISNVFQGYNIRYCQQAYQRFAMPVLSLSWCYQSISKFCNRCGLHNGFKVWNLQMLIFVLQTRQTRSPGSPTDDLIVKSKLLVILIRDTLAISEINLSYILSVVSYLNFTLSVFSLSSRWAFTSLSLSLSSCLY